MSEERRLDEIGPVDTRWVRYRAWVEEEFQYAEYYVSLGRAGIAVGEDHMWVLGHNPPLVIVEREVKEI